MEKVLTNFERWWILPLNCKWDISQSKINIVAKRSANNKINEENTAEWKDWWE